MEHNLILRKHEFNQNNLIPRFWNNGSAAKTYVFNAMGIFMPTFERLVLNSVLQFRTQIYNNPALNKHLKGFVSQESTHSAQFIKYNQFLQSQGYDIQKLEKQNQQQFLSLARYCSIKTRLAMTVGIEHITAVMGDLVLTDSFWFEGAHPAMADIWRWHAIEEIDHKSVTFDVYQHCNLGYFRRVWGMILVSVIFMVLLTRNIRYLAKRDNQSIFKETMGLLFGKPGFLRKLIGPYLYYFWPRFHPWKIENYHLVFEKIK